MNKVFVGNVPFQCTRDDFQNCFKHIDGYVNADIMRRYGSKISRGFGFVIFETDEHAANLLLIENIMLKDRKLRFSLYNIQEKSRTYLLYVSNIDKIDTDDELAKCFVTFQDILSTNVIIRNNNKYGIVKTTSKKTYSDILNSELILDGTVMNVKPFKKKRKIVWKNNDNQKNHHWANPIEAYNEGFKAGSIIGFQQGLQQGLGHK